MHEFTDSSNKTEELPKDHLSKNIEVSGELTTKSEKVDKTATNRLEDVHSIVCSKISTQISEKLFSCQFCSGTFRYGSHLRKHQGVHKGIEKDKNKKKFSLETKNISREKLDLTEKLFYCQLCTGTFRYASHLRKHEGVHNGIEKDKKFILETKNISKPQPVVDLEHDCAICSKVFTLEENLRKHVKLYHHFQCRFFSQTFSEQTFLGLHMKTVCIYVNQKIILVQYVHVFQKITHVG